MTTGNHLTVRDYFDQVLVGRTLNKRAYSSQSVASTGDRTFHHILTSRGNQQLNQIQTTPNGLTFVDYLNNPVRVTCRNINRAAAPNSDPNAAKRVRPLAQQRQEMQRVHLWVPKQGHWQKEVPCK